MSDSHGRNGKGLYYRNVDTGGIIFKKNDPVRVWIYTILSLIGVAVVILSFFWLPAWLVLPGSVVGLFGVSQSFRDRRYTHWYGLAVALIIFGGPVVMAASTLAELLHS